MRSPKTFKNHPAKYTFMAVKKSQYNDNYYNEIARGYDELHGEEQNKKLATILENLPPNFEPSEDELLLDVGCGTGISTVFWNCNVVGLDPSDDLIEIARRKYPRMEFLVGLVENMPFDDDEFDIITSLTAIQNFDDIPRGLAEIRRVCKHKTGRYILSYLKRSDKAELIETEIKKQFNIIKRVEEEKDIIFFCR